VRYADFQPTTHRAPRRPPTPPTVKLDPIAPQAYDWLLNDAARLLESAADARRDAAQLIENATEYEIVAASYRRLAAMHCPDAPGAPQPQPEYAEPQHPADPDPSRFNPTWQIPDRQRAECGCAFWLGESCASCDGSVSEYASILTPWSPTSEADAAGWNDAPRHGQTEQFPLVNGEVR
jgi:hypothetical protein